jgi:hypothetical protein
MKKKEEENTWQSMMSVFCFLRGRVIMIIKSSRSKPRWMDAPPQKSMLACKTRWQTFQKRFLCPITPLHRSDHQRARTLPSSKQFTGIIN